MILLSLCLWQHGSWQTSALLGHKHLLIEVSLIQCQIACNRGENNVPPLVYEQPTWSTGHHGHPRLRAKYRLSRTNWLNWQILSSADSPAYDILRATARSVGHCTLNLAPDHMQTDKNILVPLGEIHNRPQVKYHPMSSVRLRHRLTAKPLLLGLQASIHRRVIDPTESACNSHQQETGSAQNQCNLGRLWLIWFVRDRRPRLCLGS